MDNEDEVVDLEQSEEPENQGEHFGGATAEMQITTVSGGETESILVVLTSIFMCIAIGMLLLKLHLTYDFFKEKADLEKEQKISTK
jgi:preprotein translocase subunit SecG